MPGVARQLLTFLASPRKVSKRRRPLGRSPFGVPGAGRHKSGRKKTRCAQTVFPSLSDLYPPPPATLKRHFQTGSLRIASGGCVFKQEWPFLHRRLNESCNPAVAGATT